VLLQGVFLVVLAVDAILSAELPVLFSILNNRLLGLKHEYPVLRCYIIGFFNLIMQE